MFQNAVVSKRALQKRARMFIEFNRELDADKDSSLVDAVVRTTRGWNWAPCSNRSRLRTDGAAAAQSYVRRSYEAAIKAALAARSVVDVGEELEATTPLERCRIVFFVKERHCYLDTFEDVVVVTKLGWLDPAALLRKLRTPARSR